MRATSIYDRWTQFVGRLRNRWASLGNGMLRALAEEEMRIRREELRKQITALKQRG